MARGLVHIVDLGTNGSMLILVQSLVRTGSGRRGALLSVENDILRMAKDYDYRRLRARLSGVVSMEKLRALGASRMAREW